MTGRMRRLRLPVLAAGLLVALGLLLNVGGWRARIVARLLRIDNDPIVVLPPPDFQPRVPAGFKVSVFAAEIQQPRWLAVAPNGDVFVADSSAGQVVVLGEGPGLGQPASRAVFADGLKLPFGIAFHRWLCVHCQHERSRALSLRSKDVEAARPGGAYPRSSGIRIPPALDPNNCFRAAAAGCLCRLGRGPTSQSSPIPAVPRSWLRTLMGRTCESTPAGCETR